LISDDGSGFDPEILDNLGSSFSSRQGNGMGLGLMIVSKIISEHGTDWGAFNTHSGAVVWFELGQS
jgi:nitrogen fixation/metabolism regulation signal transduction histidine kinase